MNEQGHIKLADQVLCVLCLATPLTLLPAGKTYIKPIEDMNACMRDKFYIFLYWKALSNLKDAYALFECAIQVQVNWMREQHKAASRYRQTSWEYSCAAQKSILTVRPVVMALEAMSRICFDACLLHLVKPMTFDPVSTTATMTTRRYSAFDYDSVWRLQQLLIAEQCIVSMVL